MTDRHLPPPFMLEGMAFQIFRTARSFGHAFRQVVIAHGVNRTSGMILAQLAHAQGGMTATTLRQCVGVTAASMSKTLADLEREGLINRTPNPDDARSMLIHMTEHAEELMRVFSALVAEIEGKALTGFSDAEREQLKTMLERLRANIGEEDSESEFEGMVREDHNIG
jgi:MarR family transcriptional regulator for hemolysin